MSQPTQSWASASTTTTAQSMDSTPPTSTSSHSRPPTSTNTRYPPPPTDKPYPGSGTPQDPFIVGWVPDDPENPYNWSKTRRWFITAQVRLFSPSLNKQNSHPHSQLAMSTFTVSFSSSAYTGGLQGIQRDLNVSNDIAILGISLYVLGFALGCFHSPPPPSRYALNSSSQSLTICTPGRGT